VAFALAAVLTLAVTAQAMAQRLQFERTLDVTTASTLDVLTGDGKVDVVAGEPGRIVVRGTVTVRVGWNVPANAIAIARRIAAQPPIEHSGSTIRLRPPADPVDRHAVLVSYQVAVPPDTRAVVSSQSGAVTVEGLAAPVDVKTQSSSIALARIASDALVSTASGAVTLDGVTGATTVTTASSGITARGLRGGLRARTASGAVDATLTGPGAVDVETGSSSITLTGVAGSLVASTRSGRVRAEGRPGGPWQVSTGSGAIDVALDRSTGVTLEGVTGSGSVRVAGTTVDGTVTTRRVAGAIGGGGPRVGLESRSGSIRVEVRAAD
jgi:hypothetical protein